MPLIGMSGSAVMLLPAMEALRVAADSGYDAFEIMGEFPQCVADDISESQREEARAFAESAGLALSIHAPFTSLNIAALNPGIRAESLRQTIAAIDLCADVGGRSVVVHNGKFILSQKYRETTPDAFDIQWKYNLDSLKRASERAGERGVTLCLENIGFEPANIDRNAEDMLKIRDEAGSSALAFCVDIGHARLNGELPGVIEKLGPFTRHIHFTDNFGEKDDHLVIGKGNFDYAPHLDFFRGFADIIILEVIHFGTNPSFAQKSLEYARKLFGS